jgi:ElaB/YqjD/DUF883 family membrane-anchored ribosome-binding protein
MAENPDTIKQEIYKQREALGANLQRLENRFRTVTNWRTWVDRKPLVALGIAFGAGLFLATRK